MKTQFDRNQAHIDAMFNAALREEPVHRGRELLNLARARGVRGIHESHNYNFGNRYSRPAIVVDGKIRFVK